MDLEVDKLPKDDSLQKQYEAQILLRMTYISRYNSDNANIEVARILEQSRRNNESNGITGVLVMNENYFLQVIEGSRAVINTLLQKLIKDERHTSLRIVECHEVQQRHWSKWSMQYLTLSEQHKEDVLKFSPEAKFNPYLMTASQIKSFIKALSKRQKRQEKRVSKMKDV